MPIVTTNEASSNLSRLIDETISSHEPVFITGKGSNAVLISEEDWKAIQETIYLLSIPGMRESIMEGIKTPFEECSKEIEW